MVVEQEEEEEATQIPFTQRQAPAFFLGTYYFPPLPSSSSTSTASLHPAKVVAKAVEKKWEKEREREREKRRMSSAFKIFGSSTRHWRTRGSCFLARIEHPPCVYFLQPCFLARIKHPPYVPILPPPLPSPSSKQYGELSHT